MQTNVTPNEQPSATASSATLHMPFDNTYARELEGFYVPYEPRAVAKPKLLRMNHGLAEELGLDVAALDDAVLASHVVSGGQHMAVAGAGMIGLGVGDGVGVDVGLAATGGGVECAITGAVTTDVGRGGWLRST